MLTACVCGYVAWCFLLPCCASYTIRTATWSGSTGSSPRYQDWSRYRSLLMEPQSGYEFTVLAPPCRICKAKPARLPRRYDPMGLLCNDCVTLPPYGTRENTQVADTPKCPDCKGDLQPTTMKGVTRCANWPACTYMGGLEDVRRGKPARRRCFHRVTEMVVRMEAFTPLAMEHTCVSCGSNVGIPKNIVVDYRDGTVRVVRVQ